MVVEWSLCVSHISTVYMYKNALQNYFCETMKYEKMNDGVFLYFYASIVNISYRVFMLRKNYLHGLEFLVCHDENCLFHFSNASFKK